MVAHAQDATCLLTYLLTCLLTYLLTQVVAMLKKHLPVVKQCFRLYTLIGAFDENPSDISLWQVVAMLTC